MKSYLKIHPSKCELHELNEEHITQILVSVMLQIRHDQSRYALGLNLCIYLSVLFAIDLQHPITKPEHIFKRM